MKNQRDSPQWRRIAFTGLVIAGIAVVFTMNSQPDLIGSSTPDLSAVIAAVNDVPVPAEVVVGGGEQAYDGGGYVKSSQAAHYDRTFGSSVSCEKTKSLWMDALDRAGYFYDLSDGTGQSSIRLRDSKYKVTIELYQPAGRNSDCLGTLGASST